MEGKITAATTNRNLGTRCAISMLAIQNDTKMRWVDNFDRWLYPSGSSVVIED